MRIRTRALLVVVIVVAAIGTLSLMVGLSVASLGLHKREDLEVQATLLRANDVFALRTDQLERTSKDWSVWDDTYQYLQDRNAEFARGNLDRRARSRRSTWT